MQALFKPVTVTVRSLGGGAAARYAAWRNVKADSAWRGEIARANTTGEDLATTSWGRFGAQLVLTIPHRFMKLGKELTYLPDLVMVWTWTAGDFMQVARFFVRLMFAFLLFKIIGRNSVAPLMYPSSIFWTTQGPVDTTQERARAASYEGMSAPIVAAAKPVTSLF
eukprot:TRINITY_DN8696_c0_g2_i4.p1 TRINITY_DN8696_c0_g2~~TRINITY_DN8696_c0_g2_i4.p1  ORF type:complete len:166 (+),score=45.13 TRINITY_DN8696_c0_g2_i4:112-609(+)